MYTEYPPTPAASSHKWLAGGRTAAVVSGAYCISSNLNGTNGHDIDFGGTGWIIEPEEGTVLETTSSQQKYTNIRGYLYSLGQIHW